jgi:2-oxo-4-hydroxy-4-carboxy--5-ureidoimidazoline (OHCU) decarboxylase
MEETNKTSEEENEEFLKLKESYESSFLFFFLN